MIPATVLAVLASFLTMAHAVDWTVNTPASALSAQSPATITWSVDTSATTFPDTINEVTLFLMDSAGNLNDAATVATLGTAPLSALSLGVTIPDVASGNYFIKMGASGSFKYSGLFGVNGGSATTTSAAPTTTSTSTSTSETEATSTGTTSTKTTSSTKTTTPTKTVTPNVNGASSVAKTSIFAAGLAVVAAALFA